MAKNIKRKCRCCLEEGRLINLWGRDQRHGDRIVYGDMIKECFSLPFQKPVSEDEYICQSCAIRVKNALSFKKQILASDRFLRELNNERDQKNESDGELYLDIECLLDDDCQDLSEALITIKEEPVEVEESTSMPGQSVLKDPCIVKKEDLGEKSSDENTGKKKKRNNKLQTTRNIQELETLNCIRDYSNATPLKGFNGRAYECFFCPENYEKPSDLKQHTLAEHKDEDFVTKNVFRYALKVDITNLTCVICQANVSLVTDLFEHFKVKHGINYNKRVLNFLIPFNFDGEELKCVMCGAGFVYFKILYEHMSSHFRNFECKMCGCCFMTRASCKQHMRRHANEEHKCGQCTKIYRTRALLTEHVNQCHLKKKLYRCSYCGQKFLTLVKKKDHEVTEHGAKEIVFRCQSCDKTYRTRKGLTSHIKDFHLMLRAHKCTVCDKSFSQPRFLMEHMVKHTKSRDFVCSICNKGLSRRSTLREHMRSHFNERRFKCELCDSTFLQKCSLKGHIASKHPHYAEV